MKVLVTGAGGQIGHDVVAVCTSAGDEVVATATRSWTSPCGLTWQPRSPRSDPTSSSIARRGPRSTTARAIRTGRSPPTPTRCDGYARRASSPAPTSLTISTDFVFDGTLDRPYHERDAPNPLSVYGRSKLAGEREAGPDATVVRTSWVCGEHGSNMVRTVLRLAAERDTLSFVDDQRGCPTFSADLAPMLRRLAVERRSGIHHVTNQGAVSWYEFVRGIVAVLGKDPEMVRPIRAVDLDPPRPAARPANGVLDNAVLREAGLPLLRDYREPLVELVARLTG